MATIRQPVDSQPLVEPELRFIGTRTWLNFFRLIARVLESLREVAVITTVDVTPAAAATADGVPTAVSVTSPNATASPVGYVQATEQTVVTLANEIKGDVNQLVTDFNALVTQFDALVTQVNVINTQLTATIALVNEIKASQNAQSIALNS